MKKASEKQKEELSIGLLVLDVNWTLEDLSRWLELQSFLDTLKLPLQEEEKVKEELFE